MTTSSEFIINDALLVCDALNTRAPAPAELVDFDKLKPVLIGEFTIPVAMRCSACDFDGAQNECEVCGGEVDYLQSVDVPWTTIKEILKAAALTQQPASKDGVGP